MKNGANIKNITAYLNKAFECDFRPQETEHEKEQQAKAEQKRLEAAQEVQRKAKLKALETEFNQQRTAKVYEYLETLDENKTNILKQQFIDKMNQNPIFKNTLSEPNYRENHIIKASWINFIAIQFLPKEFNSFQVYSKEVLKDF